MTQERDEQIIEENTILFSMAETRLSSKKDTGLSEAFGQLECKRIGNGKPSDNVVHMNPFWRNLSKSR